MKEAITKAVREMNAAKNSYIRAMRELNELIPPDITVMHCLPGESGQPDVTYWTYGKSAMNAAPATGADKLNDVTRAIVIEAPGFASEYLPRLP